MLRGIRGLGRRVCLPIGLRRQLFASLFHGGGGEPGPAQGQALSSGVRILACL